jgi:hypothetical protein
MRRLLMLGLLALLACGYAGAPAASAGGGRSAVRRAQPRQAQLRRPRCKHRRAHRCRPSRVHGKTRSARSIRPGRSTATSRGGSSPAGALGAAAINGRVIDTAGGSAQAAGGATTTGGGTPGGAGAGAGASPPAPGTGSPAPGPISPAPASLQLFSAQSIFNQALGRSPTLAPNSAGLVAAFERQVHDHYGHVVINTTQWSAPVYVVAANAPTTAFVGDSSICPRPGGVFSGFQAQIQAIPVPSDAIPAAGSDSDLIVWQPSSGHLWELWRARHDGGQWSACWGGEIADAYSSDGILPAPFGVSASGLSILGGQIHLEDLRRGAIDHALEVSLPDTASSGPVWPANRDDGTSNAADAIPEGTRMRLNPALDLGALHLNPAATAVAAAIQRYGMIVSDTAGAVALQAQDPSPLIRAGQPNPYDTLLGSDPYAVLDAIPWDQLQVVSPSYRG